MLGQNRKTTISLSMAAEAMKAAKVCAEKRELLAAYENSVREVMALQSQQLGALAGNGEAIERFELEIERARRTGIAPRKCTDSTSKATAASRTVMSLTDMLDGAAVQM